MSNTNRVQTIGLLNALELIAPETAATVEQLSALCEIVNFNARSAARVITSLEEELAQQKVFNQELLNLLGKSNENINILADIVDVIDVDIDGVYTDINFETDLDGTFERQSVIKAEGKVETFEGSNVYILPEESDGVVDEFTISYENVIWQFVPPEYDGAITDVTFTDLETGDVTKFFFS